MRLTHNPKDGLIYVFGGDQSGMGAYADSGRNEMFTYSIFNDEWKLEQPYCRPDGGPQPSGPDEFGWVYDSRRDVLWNVPGFTWDHTGACPDGNLLRGEIMSYSTTTKEWTVEGRTNIFDGLQINPGNARFAQYDPVDDTFIVIVGEAVVIYNLQTDTYERVSTNGVTITGAEYTAMDPVGRKIYLTEDRYTKRLYEYDMNERVFSDAGPLPASTQNMNTQESMPHWDPINKVILWPLQQGADDIIQMLYVYHPDTKTWEEIPIVHPEGTQVAGRNSVFDPYQNVLMVMGPKLRRSPVFLFRYGNGDGTVADSVAPSAPTNISVQ
jgi:hypothetical protein